MAECRPAFGAPLREGPRAASQRAMLGPERRTGPKRRAMRQQPDGQRRRALAASGIGRGVVEISVHIENMHIFGRGAQQRLRRSDNNTAVAANQQANMHGLLQHRRDTLADAVPGDSWAGQLRIGGME